MKSFSNILFFIAIFAFIITFSFSFGVSSAFADTIASTGESEVIQARNEDNTNYFVFSDKVFSYSIIAANYICPFADRVEFNISTRNGSIPEYSYSIAVTFYDINGIIKNNSVFSENGTTTQAISRVYNCNKGYAWAADYVEYSLSVTYSGSTQSTSGRLYFFNK